MQKTWNSYFPKKDIQMTSKNMKKLNLLIIIELQYQTTIIWQYLILARVAKIKRENTIVGENVDHLELWFMLLAV